MFSSNFKHYLTIATGVSAGFLLTKLLWEYYHSFTLLNTNDNLHNRQANEELIREQLRRNYQFFGENAMSKLRNSYVIIIGGGSLGSHVAMSLIRSGIKHIKVIDPNKITPESLSTNAFATFNNIGEFKVDVIKAYASTINYEIRIDCVKDYFTSTNGLDLLFNENDTQPDFIVDCLGENLKEKSQLINLYASSKAKEKNVQLILSMDYLNRRDSSKIRIDPFTFVKDNLFAKKLSQLYREMYNKAIPNILTVYSIEQKLINNNNQFEKDKSFICIVAASGQSISSKIICHLTNWEEEHDDDKEKKDIQKKNMPKTNKKDLKALIENFEKQNKSNSKEITIQHYGKIIKSFHSSSAISNANKKDLMFSLWRPFKPTAIDNIITITKDEHNTHSSIKTEEELQSKYSKETMNKVDNVLISNRNYFVNKE